MLIGDAAMKQEPIPAGGEEEQGKAAVLLNGACVNRT